jgi:hypothetical protein
MRPAGALMQGALISCVLSRAAPGVAAFAYSTASAGLSSAARRSVHALVRSNAVPAVQVAAAGVLAGSRPCETHAAAPGARQRRCAARMCGASSSVEAAAAPAAADAAAAAAASSNSEAQRVRRTRVKAILEAADDSIVGSEVVVKGWIRTKRGQKTFTFLEVKS